MKRYQRRMACWLVFCLIAGLFGGCGKKEEKVVIGGNGTGLPAATQEEQQEEESPEVFIYKATDQSLGLMTFIKVGGGYREFTFSFSGATLIYDRYGAAETVEELKPGDVFALTVDENTQKIKKMEESADVWVFEDVENYAVNTDADMLSVGQDDYRLTENVPVFDGEEQFTRNQIGTADVLTLIGYKKTLLSVQITTAHGKLAFKNAEKFEGGYFVLGNVAAARIAEGVKMKVRAGEFLLKVAAKGQGGSKKITIKPGKTTTVDLKEFEGSATKMCKLTFELMQEGTQITINGQKVDTQEGTSLAYGAYRIVATLDGYETWSRLLFVNSKEAVISIDLSEESRNSSGSANQSSTTGTNGSAGSLAGSKTGSKNGTDTTSGSDSSTTGNTNSTTTGESTTTTENDGQDSTQSTTDSTSNDNSLVNEVMDILTGND